MKNKNGCLNSNKHNACNIYNKILFISCYVFPNIQFIKIINKKDNLLLSIPKNYLNKQIEFLSNDFIDTHIKSKSKQ